jgi:hypothetical protein
MDVCHLGAPVENITKMLKEIEGEAELERRSLGGL